MKDAHVVRDLPPSAAVYALYGGSAARRYVAYVGIATNVRRRMYQHLVRRSSSVVTGAAAVSLNPELVTAAEWWEHEDFGQSETLKAAELVAFEVLDPVLRSRGNVSEQAEVLAQQDAFREAMTTLFANGATGRFTPLSLDGAMARIRELEQRVIEVERQLREHFNAIRE